MGRSPLADRFAAEREQRGRPGSCPWIHRYSRLRESEGLVRTLTGGRAGCAVSPDGTWIVSAGRGSTRRDNTLKIWDAVTGTERATLTGHTSSVWGCAVSPDATWIVSASEDGTLKIWDADAGTERATLTGHTGSVWGCAMSRDGTWIVAASADGTLRIWDVAIGAERAVLVLPGKACGEAFHPSTPMVACGDSGRGVHLAHLVGIGFGPLVVTAAARGDELTARCPACREAFPIERDSLGTETTCPRPACGTRLRLNPFTLHSAKRDAGRSWPWLRRGRNR